MHTPSVIFEPSSWQCLRSLAAPAGNPAATTPLLPSGSFSSSGPTERRSAASEMGCRHRCAACCSWATCLAACRGVCCRLCRPRAACYAAAAGWDGVHCCHWQRQLPQPSSGERLVEARNGDCSRSPRRPRSTKLRRAHSSFRLFSIGVPLRTTLFSASKFSEAWCVAVPLFLIF